MDTKESSTRHDPGSFRNAFASEKRIGALEKLILSEDLAQPLTDADEGVSLAEAALLLQQGAFRLNTRRIGSLAEELVQRLTGYGARQNPHHDLFDSESSARIEVKFSTVMRKCSHLVAAGTIFAALRESLEDTRKVALADRFTAEWSCSIQQIKSAEFEMLYYGLFFADAVLIFKARVAELEDIPRISQSQHKGNVGEGQFKLTPGTLTYHMNSHLFMQLSYEELAVLLKGKKL